MTKIVLALFITVLALHIAAAILTYTCVSSNMYFEGNPSTAELQTSFGLTGGLILTLIEGTALSALPLTIFVAMSKFTFSSKVTAFEKEKLTGLLKFFSFPLAVVLLAYLGLIAGFDVAHDFTMLLSGGRINLWTFCAMLINSRF